MRAARLRAPRQWELIDADDKDPQPGSMLVRMEQVALCGSDMPEFHGTPLLYPRPQGGTGHEGLGRVQACPSGSYREGERVLLWGFGREEGLFQEQVLTTDQGLLSLPADGEPEVLLMSQLLGTVLRCFRRLGNVLDLHAVVVGQGPAGLLFDAVLRNLGARTIIGIDPLDYRLEAGRLMGATHTVNPTRDPDLAEAIGDLTGGALADLVVEAVGAETTYGWCADLVRRQGTVIGFGVPDKENHNGVIQLPLLAMQRREVRLVMSVNAGDNPIDDYTNALDWILQGRLDVRPLVSHILPFADIQLAFELAADKPVDARPVKVVLRF